MIQVKVAVVYYYQQHQQQQQHIYICSCCHPSHSCPWLNYRLCSLKLFPVNRKSSQRICVIWFNLILVLSFSQCNLSLSLLYTFFRLESPSFPFSFHREKHILHFTRSLSLLSSLSHVHSWLVCCSQNQGAERKRRTKKEKRQSIKVKCYFDRSCYVILTVMNDFLLIR